MKLGNFNRDYLDSIMGCEGYYDAYNSGKSALAEARAKNVVDFRRSGVASVVEDTKTYYLYEFSFMPNIGILADSDPLMTDCELFLDFGRSKPETSVIKIGTGDNLTSIDLLHCHAITEYVSSPALRSNFQTIDQNPIVYNFDDIDVYANQLPLNDTVVRFHNIKAGNMPSYVFAGIIPSSAISGDDERSSTGFEWNNVKEFNLTLNGVSCNGFPINVRHQGSVVPLQQFHDVCGRFLNTEAGSGLTLTKFETNYIWAHRFEAERTAHGRLGVDLRLEQLLDYNATLVVWIVSPQSLSIDKFHQIEQLSK